MTGRNCIIHRDAGLLTARAGPPEGVAVFGLDDSPLSPWYRGKLRYKNRSFTSVAQVVAWLRARRFHAVAIADEILSVTDPLMLRELSRSVPADEGTWIPELERQMPPVLHQLVGQNPESLVALMATVGRRIAFAVKGDLAWGIGLSLDDPDVTDPAAWPGKNRLGEVLGHVRDGFCGELLPLFGAPAERRNLDDGAIAEVLKLVNACFALAEDLYDRQFVPSEVRLDLHGETAGQATWIKGQRESVIRFNPVLLSENWTSFKDRTVPHEVAHVVTRDLYGEEVRAHGAEWQSVMRDFGCEVTRCHGYSVANASTNRGSRAVMYCTCRIHLVSQAKAGKPLRCARCGSALAYVIGEVDLVERVGDA